MQILVWYGPLLKSVLSPLVTFGLICFFHRLHYSPPDSVVSYPNWLWFSSGVFYTHIFEYFYHRYALHASLPGLKNIQKSHHQHHRVFHPLNYKTTNPDDLLDIAMRWYIFPILLLSHYLFFLAICPKSYLKFALIFFLGVVLRFLTYETTHYFSHLKDNFFDRLISKLPLLRKLRAYQDGHHCYHHLCQTVNFGFVPDYVPDWLGKTLFPKHQHK